MSNLVALAFQDIYAADEARAALRRMEGDGLIELGETATIVRTPGGRLRISQDLDVVAADRRVGPLAGLVAAAATGALPFMLVGPDGGRLVDSLRDHGITSQVASRLDREVDSPGSMLLLVGTSDAVRRKRIAERLIPWGPSTLEMTLPSELEEELQKPVEGRHHTRDDQVITESKTATSPTRIDATADI
jgi:uncharacterized membrane protein